MVLLFWYPSLSELQTKRFTFWDPWLHMDRKRGNEKVKNSIRFGPPPHPHHPNPHPQTPPLNSQTPTPKPPNPNPHHPNPHPQNPQAPSPKRQHPPHPKPRASRRLGSRTPPPRALLPAGGAAACEWCAARGPRRSGRAASGCKERAALCSLASG